MSDYRALGIDVSYHNGVIDWNRVKKSGKVEFAIIRAGYGKNNVDKQARYNVSECNRLEIPCGLYWFSYALTPEMAGDEACYVLDFAKSYKIEYPIFYDFEHDSRRYMINHGKTFSSEIFNEMCRSFCENIESEKYYASIYCNNEYFKKLTTETLKKHDFWYARYTIVPIADSTKVNLWQYSDSGVIPGIVGKVDLDASYIDYPKIIAKAGLNRR